MRKKRKSLITLIISFSLFLGGIYAANNRLIGQIHNEIGESDVSPNYQATVPYLDHRALEGWCGVTDVMYYEFSGTYGVSIIVLIMDIDSYESFLNYGVLYLYEDVDYWILAYDDSASGSVTLGYYTDWVIVFYNIDPEHSTSLLTYSAWIDFGAIYSITEPDPGEIWVTGQTYMINWIASGYIPTVTIELLDSYSFLQYIAIGYSDPLYSPGGLGSYSWTIPAGLTHSTTYQIRIKNYDNAAQVLTSSYFTINEAKSITVLSPTSSDSWQEGTTHATTWTSTGSISSVDIYLICNGIQNSNPFVSETANDGYYSWFIIAWPDSYGDIYQIKIQDSAIGSHVSDTSDGYFAITEAPLEESITVTNPTASTSWQAGTTQSVTWTSTEGISNVAIELFYDGYYHSSIITSTSNDGSYMWLSDTY
ncbi:MAG: Ser-Thr-rich GPI-anchored membrane family protein [Candidatus Heimdallarchaeota archaeon]